MTNTIFYLATLIIWGSTWLAIQYQLDTVDPLWSVAYRFGLASLILFIFCFIARKPLYFTRKQHAAVILQSILLFSVNYILYYVGSQQLISGYVALTGASIAVVNIFNARLFLKTPLNSRIIMGAILGICGLVVVFWHEFITAAHVNDALTPLIQGVIYCLIATYIASLGNMVSKYNQNLQLPVLQSNAWGMMYGTISTVLIAVCMGKPPTFDLSSQYILSLGYLSFFGTVIAFGTYLKLVGNIGPERAAYIFVITPIVALILSSYYEDFHWTLSTFMGIALILTGNLLVRATTVTSPVQTSYKG